jgi:hypothetical protein
MKEQLEVINASWEKITPKDNKYNLWSFLLVIALLIFTLFYLLLFTIPGWFIIVLGTLLYKTLL